MILKRGFLIFKVPLQKLKVSLMTAQKSLRNIKMTYEPKELSKEM